MGGLLFVIVNQGRKVDVCDGTVHWNMLAMVSAMLGS